MEDATDVIIVTYRTGPILKNCIESVLKLRGLGKLIIVDNGNSKEYEDMLANFAQNRDRVILISGHGNVGFARACNLGAARASAKFMLLLNPDCLVSDPDILIKFIGVLESDPKYKVASCLILNSDGSVQKTCRRNLLTPLTSLSESLNLYKILPLPRINLPLEEIQALPEISEAPTISGACIFTYREYYDSLGGLCEEYFMHVEDSDFCMRLYLIGDKIAFAKNISVKHALSTSDVSSVFLEKHKARGFVIYMEKFFPKLRVFPINLILRTLIWTRFAIKVIFRFCN